MNLVQPRLSKGLRDLLPEDTLARQAMIDVVRGVYELYGFVPLTTPAVEYLDVLSGSGGKDIQESIFIVQNPEEEQLGLRFDHTVPLARVIAQYRDLPRPFRRYTIGPVARGQTGARPFSRVRAIRHRRGRRPVGDGRHGDHWWYLRQP